MSNLLQLNLLGNLLLGLGVLLLLLVGLLTLRVRNSVTPVGLLPKRVLESQSWLLLLGGLLLGVGLGLNL
jgi:uncharacterized iron-regulated membrane protein